MNKLARQLKKGDVIVLVSGRKIVREVVFENDVVSIHVEEGVYPYIFSRDYMIQVYNAPHLTTPHI